MLWREIAWREPFLVFKHFINFPGIVFLDSAQKNSLGRYSYIAFDPFDIITAFGKNDILDLLEKKLEIFSLETIPGLPPFQGGLCGFFSYEMHSLLENTPRANINDFLFPDLAVGLYDLVISFDHQLQKMWVVSSGFPGLTKKMRFKRAQARIAWVLQELKSIKELKLNEAEIYANISSVSSNFDKKNYIAAINKVKNYILAGDVFEVNIARRFSANIPYNLTPLSLYRRLRECNPASFASFINIGNICLLSSSPERFVKLNDGVVETRPIKGTCVRDKNKKIDAENAYKLLNSAKDRSENIMIVDLLRNDLSRICNPGSISVPKLCGLESFETVHHLVSVVLGRLKPQTTSIDVLRALFPGGSITGAPKIRSIEIIAELEPVVRGPYCGCAGFIGFDGSMDMSITIRSFVISDARVSFQAGGAIVLDSDPEAEFAETGYKISALWRALTGVNFCESAYDFVN